MSIIRSLSTQHTTLPPSCILFHPTYSDIAIVGTYFLEQQAEDAQGQSRSGSVHTYRLVGNEIIEYGRAVTCASGILDIALSPHDPTFICAASSIGSLIFLRLETHGDAPILQLISEVQLYDTEVLILDLVFHPVQPKIIGLTLSSGATNLVEVHSLEASSLADTNVQHLQLIHEATLEAWTLEFAPSGNAIFMGADDASLAMAAVDLKEGFEPAVTINKRIHTAGVTSILPLHCPSDGDRVKTTVLLTGSYDDRLVVSRHPRTPAATVLAELDLGGGVWRIYPVDTRQGQNSRRWIVLCACMYAGAMIVEVRCNDWDATVTGNSEGDGGWGMKLLASFKEHESMCYGCAVRPPNGHGGSKTIIVSTSFYDKRMCVWEFEIPPWG